MLPKGHNILYEGINRSSVQSTVLNWASYDVSLTHAVKNYMNFLGIPDPNMPGALINKNPQEIDQIRKTSIFCTNIFSDAIWGLCRRGILRPGENRNGNLHSSSVRTLDEGYSVTKYGLDWITKYNKNLLPADPTRLTRMYDTFQHIYGINYFKRAKEAVSCFNSANYLACCVMCGAATESILLAVGFALSKKEEILKIYKTSSGRSKLENQIFGKTPQRIKDKYKKYTDLINYWRDESGHGDESEIDVDEAYIALLTLLRCAEFIKDHWDEILNQLK